MMRYLLLLLLALPMISYAECDPDLSSGDECWTNCLTNDDITICDIIKLDTFWPESETQNSNTFQANSQSSALNKMFKTKTLKDGRIIKGRFINKRRTNIATNNGLSKAKDLKPAESDGSTKRPSGSNSNLKSSHNNVTSKKKCKDPLKEGGWCVKIDEIKTPPGW